MKKLLAFLLITAATLALLVSCAHTHTFAGEWSSDEENHWREATCEHADEKTDFGAHVDTNEDGDCDTCSAELHQHTFSQAWICDTTKHWREATCSHTELKEGEAAHVDEDENGRCDVCMYDGMHKHTFNTAAWNFDETGHWHPATCEGHENKKGSFAPHATADNDGVCDTCGFDEMHVHTFSDTEWAHDDNNHWRPATCGHTDEKYDVTPHATADNDGICDDCGFDNMHIHTLSDSEYLSSTEGHWFKASCGHEDYVDELLPHVDVLDDGVCDDCGRRLKYNVTTVVTQPDKVTVIGATEALVAIGGDATFTVKVDSKYALYVTTGGGEIVDTTTEGGFTTYTVKVTNVADDVELTFVAKVENAYDLSRLPGTPETNTVTKNVYFKDGVFTATPSLEAIHYQITYENVAKATYDAETFSYKVEKTSRILSITVGGEETTIEWQGVTYGASGEGVVNSIPNRDWLGISRNFQTSHGEVTFGKTDVIAVDPEIFYEFSSDIIVLRDADGPALELWVPSDGGGYQAMIMIYTAGGKVVVYSPGVGAAMGSKIETGVDTGTAFNVRVTLSQNPGNAANMDVNLYIDGAFSGSCTVGKINQLRMRFQLRDDGNPRNSTVTFFNTKSVAYIAHTHTFDESTWLSDGNGHWHAPTCGHDVKGNYAEHDSAENNGVCDVCGKTDIHVHTASDSEYLHDVTGHWFAPTCGHAQYKSGFAAHTDEDSDDICDVCDRELNCVVDVKLESTYALLVTEGVIKGAPGSDVTFTVSAPITHTLVVVGAEIVSSAENAGIKTYTLKVAAIASDTTVSVYTKRDGGTALPSTDPANKTVTVWDNEGTFATSDNGGTKYVITYTDLYCSYDEATGSTAINKVAKIVSIKDANNEEATITWGGVTYGASGEDVVDTIPTRDFLGLSRAFATSYKEFTLWKQLVDSETLYHFEADVKVDINSAVSTSILQLQIVKSGGVSGANSAITYDASTGTIKIYGFGKDSALGNGFVTDVLPGEVFNFAFDVYESTETPGSYDIVVYVNGVEAVRSTITSFADGSGRIFVVPQDDGAQRNNVVTLSNVYFTQKQAQ